MSINTSSSRRSLSMALLMLISTASIGNTAAAFSLSTSVSTSTSIRKISSNQYRRSSASSPISSSITSLLSIQSIQRNGESTHSSSSSSALNLSPTNFIYRSRLHQQHKNKNGNGNGGGGRYKSAVEVSSTMPHADLAVRLDQPILSSSTTQFRSNASTMLKSILTILLSDVAKTACVAFILAFIITFLSKSSSKTLSKLLPLITSTKHVLKLIQGQVTKINDGLFKRNEKESGIPMVFDTEDDGSVSWGVCTLASKKKIGRSKFMKYEFKLPKADNILNLALGQKVSLCCLDNEDKVAKKDYYLFSPKSKKGSFSILARADGLDDDDFVKLAKGEGDFRKVLSKELDVGDEIALQPGPRTLSYRGEYLPVTDMLYIASGSGIAPVLDQVKAVLPSGSSSVKSVTVIWTNDKEEDFDVALSSLEDEYFKYSTKLAVSCVVDENKGRRLDQNQEIDEALPPFEPGTMAVIAGPKKFVMEARSMLMDYGYPDECICPLP